MPAMPHLLVAFLMFTAAASMSAQCTSEVVQIASRSQQTSVVAGPAAWNGSMLAVASNQVRNGSVWLTLYDEHGTRLYPAVKVPSSEDARIDEIFWNGSHFAVFFETAEHKLVLRRFSTAGELIGTAITPLPTVTLGDDDDLDILWSSRLGAYVIARVAHLPARGLWLSIINPDGTVRSNTQRVIPAAQSLVRVSESESGILGIFFEQDVSRNLMYLRVQEGERDVVKKVWTPGDDLVVTSLANLFVLARTAEQPDARKIIRWKAIDTDGFEVRQETRLLIGTGLDVRPVSLITNGNEVALAYLDARDGFDVQDPSFRLRRFDLDNNVLADTYFAAADRTHHRAFSEYDFLWTGQAYLTPAVRDTDDGDDSFLLRLCPLRAAVSAPHLSKKGDTVTFTGVAEGGVPGYEYVWTWNQFDRFAGQNLQLRYDVPGTYTVRLTITDATDTVATKTFTVTVFEPATPKHRSVRK